MIRTCNICGATSEETAFYARVNSRCAKCHRIKVKQNREEKREYYRQYDAMRFKNDPRVRERNARYKSTQEGIASVKAARKKWSEQNPEKRAAHIILGNAVKSGRVKKPKECENCGASGRIHGHHHDYAFPLSVKWLCQTCHWKEHKD